MIGARCKTCQWWDAEHPSIAANTQDLGYCRKHYPVVYLRDGRYYGSWPLTHEKDLCGEYRKDEERG
jgi:hypothetical protein